MFCSIPDGLEMFRDFLRKEFSEENVEFWLACEEYKSLKSNQLIPRAQEIFTDFVAVQAAHEVVMMIVTADIGTIQLT